jgi:hypothetical protein
MILHLSSEYVASIRGPLLQSLYTHGKCSALAMPLLVILGFVQIKNISHQFFFF